MTHNRLTTCPPPSPVERDLTNLERQWARDQQVSYFAGVADADRLNRKSKLKWFLAGAACGVVVVIVMGAWW